MLQKGAGVTSGEVGSCSKGGTSGENFHEKDVRTIKCGSKGPPSNPIESIVPLRLDVVGHVPSEMEWRELVTEPRQRALTDPHLDRCIGKFWMWNVESSVEGLDSDGVACVTGRNRSEAGGGKHSPEGADTNCIGLCYLGKGMGWQNGDSSL